MFNRGFLFAVLLAVVGCGGDGGTGGTGGGAGGGSGGGGGAVGCTSATCAGCCLNGVCQPGSTGAACGKNASTCATCGAPQICRTDQTCGVDPASTWKVQPTSATIAPNNNGSAWDVDNSAPDVIVDLDCPPLSASAWDSSTPQSSSYAPSWSTGGCTAKASDLLASGFDFQLEDVDVTTNDTITSQLHASPSEVDFTAGRMTFSASGGMQSLTVSLVRQ